MMAEGGSDSIASEASLEYVCYYCKEDGQQLKALGFCLDCGDYLCEVCFQHHCKTRQTKHHVLMTMEQIRAENAPVKIKDTCTDVCLKHTDEIVKYYCALHDVFGCTVCITVEHRNCKGVDYIPDVSEGLSESTEVEELMSDLDILVSKSEQALGDSKKNISVAEATCSQGKEAVERFGEEITTRVKCLIDITSRKAELLRDADIQKMNSTCSSAETTLARTKALRSELDTLRKTKQGCKLFVAMKNANQGVASVNESLEKIILNNNVKTYSFQPCNKFKLILTDTESDGLGTLSSLPPKPDPEDEWLAKKNATDGTTTLDKLTATYVCEIKLRSTSDTARTCDIKGFTALSENRLLVLDKSNRKIKQIDTQKMKVVREMYLEECPTSFMQLDSCQIALFYSVGSAKWKTEILRIVGQEIVVDRHFHFETNYQNTTFKYQAEQTCFMAIDGYAFAKIDMTGECSSRKRPINIFKEKDANMLLEMNYKPLSLYVKTVDKYGRKHIGKVDFDGKLISSKGFAWKDEYRCLNDQAIGLFILTKNSIYVTPEISEEPKLLLSQFEGIYKPCCVHHCPTTNKLYVGLENSNFLKVFQLG